MQKFSHILLSNFLIKQYAHDSRLMRYKNYFRYGNILPDCRLSLLYSKHTFDSNYVSEVIPLIKKLTAQPTTTVKQHRQFAVNLGEVMHHIADYFTYAHHPSFHDRYLNLDHLIYEAKMNFTLLKYMRNTNFLEQLEEFHPITEIQTLLEHIESAYKNYSSIHRHRHTIENDCAYIVAVTSHVAKSILYYNELYTPTTLPQN